MSRTQTDVSLSDFPQDMRHAAGEEPLYDMGHDLVHYLREYAREKPEVAAMWCFGIGFILGWKLKPW